jgi:hypothetical protein
VRRTRQTRQEVVIVEVVIVEVVKKKGVRIVDLAELIYFKG